MNITKISTNTTMKVAIRQQLSYIDMETQRRANSGYSSYIGDDTRFDAILRIDNDMSEQLLAKWKK